MCSHITVVLKNVNGKCFEVDMKFCVFEKVAKCQELILGDRLPGQGLEEASGDSHVMVAPSQVHTLRCEALQSTLQQPGHLSTTPMFPRVVKCPGVGSVLP